MKKGIYLALFTALISGFAVFFNKFALSFWSNTSIYTTAKNLVAVLLLSSFIFLFNKRSEFVKLTKKQWGQLVGIGFIGGFMPFLLFFRGLSLSSSINAAFLHKTLFIWVSLLAIFFLKEKISGLQIFALVSLLAGVYLFISPSKINFGLGEALILGATFLWAVESVFAKKVLEKLPALVVAWGRMFFGSIFLLVYLSFVGGVGQLFVFSIDKLAWLFLAGAFLFLYVTTWYSALKFAPASVVSSVLVLAVPITATLNSIFVTHQLSGMQALPAILVVMSIFLVSKFKIGNERAFNVR
ncbi:DMT family transporter [Patescibacteria group bacterium]